MAEFITGYNPDGIIKLDYDTISGLNTGTPNFQGLDEMNVNYASGDSMETFKLVTQSLAFNQVTTADLSWALTTKVDRNSNMAKALIKLMAEPKNRNHLTQFEEIVNEETSQFLGCLEGLGINYETDKIIEFGFNLKVADPRTITMV